MLYFVTVSPNMIRSSILLYIVALFEISLAHLYPAPNYDSIVISSKIFPAVKQIIDYEVPTKPIIKISRPLIKISDPEETYGLPHVKVPSVIYGIPTRTFDFDLTDLIGEEVVENPQKPVEIPVVPATSYGVPVQKVAVPPSSIIINKFRPEDEQVVVKKSVIIKTFEKPSEVYGVPNPQLPTISYTLPKTQVPAVVYGVPARIAPSKPSEEYGVPSEEYGVPSVRIPALDYGLPGRFL